MEESKTAEASTMEREERQDEQPGGAETGARSERTPDDVKYDVIAQLKTVYDPEIPVDIYELGLIYELEISEDGVAHIVMTLTTPMCPAAEVLPPEVEAKAREVEGVTDVRLELVWEPPWSMDMMSPAARLALNV
jgi:FeS assembly SUF system protein